MSEYTPTSVLSNHKKDSISYNFLSKYTEPIKKQIEIIQTTHFQKLVG